MVQPTADRVRPVRIEDEMRSSYLDYAMSVIVARALPDVRDGLKPVHRRILYAMDELGLRNDRPYKKCARIVGDVLGRYHPHGDTPVYDALVRMGQDFSMRYPLVQPQGNFGSMDNDPPAAMRYTEARLAEITAEMLANIDQDTVDFVANFDDTLVEPTVLPTRLPNLLINGSSGIAVGMATNIPPHNLAEVCDGIVWLIDHPEATAEELGRFVKGPDFPTGGIILGREGIKQAFATGRGRVVIRAKTHIEEIGRGRQAIIVTELPYQTNKAALVERMAELVREKRLDGISDLRDESDRHGVRVVIELRRDAQPRTVLNSLFKHTGLQSAFSVNMLALVEGQPRVLGLKAALQHFVDFRREVVRRRTEYDLKKAQARAHILEGFKIALDHLDAVITLIRNSADAEAARNGLMTQFGMSQEQAQAVLDLQLRRLAALERQRILDELAEIQRTIADLQDILANPGRRDSIIKSETEDLKKKYGDGRRTIIHDEEAGEFSEEDLRPREEVVITLSKRGYVKRVGLDTYRQQARGGKGKIGATNREEDSIHLLMVADTHDTLLVFTDRGRVYACRGWDIDEATRQSKGKFFSNIIALNQDEKVTEIVRVADFEHGEYLIMATKLGEVKKTRLQDFAAVRSTGIIAMDLEPGDEFVAARLARQRDELVLVTRQGQAIRFSVGDDELRLASRTSGGVRGIKLAPGDRVVAMDIVLPQAELLVVSENGYGKRTFVDEYSVTHRGGQGVRAMKVTDKTGPIAEASIVYPAQDLMVITTEGIVLRTPVKDVRRTGRNAEGVKVINLDNGDRVASISCFTPERKTGSNLSGNGLGPDGAQLTLLQ